jgi:small subunit ribosomal protein S16
MIIVSGSVKEIISMAVKIRLKRMGAKKKPFYRVVVADSRSPRDGKFIEELGWFDPLKDPVEMKIDVESAKKWIGNGAQPTETAKALLKKAGVYDVSSPEDAEEEAAVEAPTTEVSAPEATVAEEAPAPEATVTEEVPAPEEAAATEEPIEEETEESTKTEQDADDKEE